MTAISLMINRVWLVPLYSRLASKKMDMSVIHRHMSRRLGKSVLNEKPTEQSEKSYRLVSYLIMGDFYRVCKWVCWSAYSMSTPVQHQQVAIFKMAIF